MKFSRKNSYAKVTMRNKESSAGKYWCWENEIHTKKKLDYITGALWAKSGISREAWNECEAEDEGKRNSTKTEKQICAHKKLLIPFVTQYQQGWPEENTNGEMTPYKKPAMAKRNL